MKVNRLTEVKPYEAGGHFDMKGFRLQGHDASDAQNFWVGLSYFLPGGGTTHTATPLEKSYVCVGGEITIKAWKNYRSELSPFFLIDDPERIRKLAQTMAFNIEVKEISSPSDTINCFDKFLPVFPLKNSVTSKLGSPESKNSKAVIESIKTASKFAMTDEVLGVVTNPIQKSVLYEAGFAFPGHTEFLGHLASTDHSPLMMFISPQLKVACVTGHKSLSESIREISSENIINCAFLAETSLIKYFNFRKPRIAIAGINPHAGENGSMGDEERSIISPAVDYLIKKGVNVDGPFAPDSLFSERARKNYDIVICMYHDQGLIPIKAIDFEETVNVSIGLPFIRTSPDHGTGIDIAGTGKASEKSLVEAIKTAKNMHIGSKRKLLPIS